MDEKLKKYLENNDVRYILHKHAPVFTVAESRIDRDIKNIPGLHCKTLFLKDDKGNFYLVGMPAEKILNSKKFRQVTGSRKIRFSTPEELKEKIGLTPGSVSIFGAFYIRGKDSSIKLVIDKKIWDAEIVGFHPNINTETLEIRHGDLEKFYKSLKCRKDILEI